MKIISTTEIQRNISIFSDIEGYYMVMNRWVPKKIILPYFEDNEDFVMDYLEEYEIRKNKKELQKELQSSLDSGLSDLSI